MYSKTTHTKFVPKMHTHLIFCTYFYRYLFYTGFFFPHTQYTSQKRPIHNLKRALSTHSKEPYLHTQKSPINTLNISLKRALYTHSKYLLKIHTHIRTAEHLFQIYTRIKTCCLRATLKKFYIYSQKSYIHTFKRILWGGYD